MKGFVLILFNVIAVYILLSFVFGSGGMLHSMEQERKLDVLHLERSQLELRVLRMRKRLTQLRQMDYLDAIGLAEQGQKRSAIVLFRMEDDTTEHAWALSADQKTSRFDHFLLVSVLLVTIISIIVGNILLVFAIDREWEESPWKTDTF